jgi:hypothetical protein
MPDTRLDFSQLNALCRRQKLSDEQFNEKQSASKVTEPKSTWVTEQTPSPFKIHLLDDIGRTHCCACQKV